MVGGCRRAAWKVLTLEPEKGFGVNGLAPGQFSAPQDLASLPDGAVVVNAARGDVVQWLDGTDGSAPACAALTQWLRGGG